LCSVTEGLGTSLFDALACRKAIVATTAGGIPEVVANGATGILVPPRDHESMARAIIDLLRDDEKRRAFGEAGRRRACERFSAEQMVSGTLQVYGRVAAPSAQLQCQHGRPAP
jgi:glycosyltransferase involved in cell wall biosynthesis